MNYNTILPPFKWFVLENFPYIEDDFDALTNWQLFCKLGKEMNKIIEKCNLTGEQVENLTNAFNSLQNYVNNYFANLDVQEEINNKLDEMAESGELTDIIAQYLQLAGVLAYDTKADMKTAENLVNGSIAKTLGNSSYSDGQGAFYKVRTIKNTDVIDNDNIIALSDDTLVAEKIPFSNGYDLLYSNTMPKPLNKIELSRICRTFERNANNPSHVSGEDYAVMQGGCYVGNNKMVIARLRRSNLDDVILQEISLDDATVIRTSDSLEIQHANSITFDPANKKLYVTSLLLNESDVNVPKPYLYKIDYETFEIDETITLDIDSNEGVHSVSYDLKADKYYIATEDFSNNNALKFYSMNITDYSLTEIELNDPTGLLAKSYNNDMLVYNNFMYILKYNPQVILCYNMITNKMTNIYNIDNYADGCGVGELQNISIKYDGNNDFILATNKEECDNGFYNMFQYFIGNIFVNSSSNIPQRWVNDERELFVDINSTSINPNGSTGNKFKHINEALEFAQQLTGNVAIFIKNGTYPFVDYKGNKERIDIRNIDGTPDITINGMNFHATNVSIVNVKIQNTSSSQNYDLSADYSQLRLANITFLGDFTSSIYARRCEIDFYNLTTSKILFHCQTETTLIPHDNVPNFTYTNQKPYFAKYNKLTTDDIATTKTRNDSPALPLRSFELTQKGTMRVYFYGHYNRGYIDFPHEGNEPQRNFPINIGRYMYEVACYFDYTNNKVGFQLLQAIQLNNDGTVTNVIDSETLYLAPYLQ